MMLCSKMQDSQQPTQYVLFCCICNKANTLCHGQSYVSVREVGEDVAAEEPCDLFLHLLLSV
jgi:hypothetical protein